MAVTSYYPSRDSCPNPRQLESRSLKDPDAAVLAVRPEVEEASVPVEEHPEAAVDFQEVEEGRLALAVVHPEVG